MDVKDLRPKIFAANPESSESKRQLPHWFKSFATYIDRIEGINDADKLDLLVNHIDSAVYKLICELLTMLSDYQEQPTLKLQALYLLDMFSSLANNKFW